MTTERTRHLTLLLLTMNKLDVTGRLDTWGVNPPVQEIQTLIFVLFLNLSVILYPNSTGVVTSLRNCKTCVRRPVQVVKRAAQARGHLSQRRGEMATTGGAAAAGCAPVRTARAFRNARRARARCSPRPSRALRFPRFRV